MSLTSSAVQERRQFLRSDVVPFHVDLLKPDRSLSASSVNFSEGGVCLRLREALEVRSLVDLQLIPHVELAGLRRPMRCQGRVAWVIQRLDLRPTPPFLFDVGIEFVDPPPALRQLMAQRGAKGSGSTIRSMPQKPLASAVIRGRQFLARLERTAAHPAGWHLVVSVDGLPCFSHHYPSEREAMAAWDRFKRQQGKR
jgi:hypothetical protein